MSDSAIAIGEERRGDRGISPLAVLQLQTASEKGDKAALARVNLDARKDVYQYHNASSVQVLLACLSRATLPLLAERLCEIAHIGTNPRALKYEGIDRNSNGNGKDTQSESDRQGQGQGQIQAILSQGQNQGQGDRGDRGDRGDTNTCSNTSGDRVWWELARGLGLLAFDVRTLLQETATRSNGLKRDQGDYKSLSSSSSQKASEKEKEKEPELELFEEGSTVDGLCVLANGSSRWYVHICIRVFYYSLAHRYNSYTCTHTHTYTPIHLYTHTFTHTHIHTHTLTRLHNTYTHI